MLLWTNILIPITSMMITVFATVYTVSKRVENENKEKHKPYLTLEDIEQKEELDEYKYYLTITGKNNSNSKNSIIVNLKLTNIGYGVASNIKFYNLLTSEQIKGEQSSTDNINQKLFTTFDIGTNEQKQVQAKIIGEIKKEENIEQIDHIRILCVYQDLNGNIYDFIISINLKTNKAYDFFAYQRTSHSYAKWIKENKTQYKNIKREYKN